jgi:deoxyribonuclease V
MKEEEAKDRGIDLEPLREEQKKLAKLISLKDGFDFKNCTRFAGIVTETLKTREIIAVIAILDENMQVVESKYTIKPAKFPYVPCFRAYRELPAILSLYDKVEDQPDVIFVLGHGVSHPRGCGIASHLGISLEKPVIGITKSLMADQESKECNSKEQKDEILIGKKVVAKKMITKEKANPIYISPGNLISLKTAMEITKRCIRDPHKLPEPIVQARKIISKVREELNL